MEIDGLRILRDGWKQQPAYLRVLSWLSYGLLRAIVGISGYARDPGQARKAPGKSV
jgi:cardiolipin synthase A/B